MTSAPRERSRRRRPRVGALAVVLTAALLFAVGVAVGEALHDNPKPGGTQTIVRTLTPLPGATTTVSGN